MSLIEHTERLRAAARGLGCSRSEAVALAVLIAGACAALALLWSTARAGESPVASGDALPAAAGDELTASGDALPGPGDALPPHDAAGAPSELSVHTAQATPAAGPVVHVSGLVANPGVYDLAPGGRVADAINAAGGTLPGAQVDGLNLARVLADGEQVHVPGPDEQPPGQADGPPANSAWLPDGRLDVNRATQAELEELPGIGPVLAERIIAHREELGGFQSTGDLLGVHGIGEKTLAALADLLAT
jgi:competence protein ComEA